MIRILRSLAPIKTLKLVYYPRILCIMYQSELCKSNVCNQLARKQWNHIWEKEESTWDIRD